MQIERRTLDAMAMVASELPRKPARYYELGRNIKAPITVVEMHLDAIRGGATKAVAKSFLRELEALIDAQYPVETPSVQDALIEESDVQGPADAIQSRAIKCPTDHGILRQCEATLRRHADAIAVALQSINRQLRGSLAVTTRGR